MANKRDLKKDINFVLGDLIEEVYVREATNSDINNTEANAIVDEAIATFDSLMNRVSQKGVENPAAHFKEVRADLQSSATKIAERINNL